MHLRWKQQKKKESLPKLRKIFQPQPLLLKDAVRETVTDLRKNKTKTEGVYQNYI